MIFNIVTAFPNFYDSFLETSLIKKAIDNEIISFNIVDIKKFGLGKYRQIDDRPYGGGCGMVLKVDVVASTLESIRNKGCVIALSPKGEMFNQKEAQSLSKLSSITLISSRYEGFDERVYSLCEKTISIGNYVTMGGEVPSLVLIEAISRLIPKVIQNKDSVKQESFSKGTEKEYPQYTKPLEFNGMKVPDILLSGNHKKIKEWRGY
ncbi:tRNA (guanosine(37)-N1)-methyltransferase TrmD [Patescibacteria group bacterium]|nr:tRNA (guanosine(37)-N1)-methyltransferase TrmD [Patescibacteria group bacterium]